jgi:hypothetical protein
MTAQSKVEQVLLVAYRDEVAEHWQRALAACTRPRRVRSDSSEPGDVHGGEDARI